MSEELDVQETADPESNGHVEPEKPVLRRFKKLRKREQIVIEDEHGQDHSYTLMELMGDQREVFIDKTSAGMKFNNKGEVVSGSIRGLHARLISMSCLDDVTGKYVPEKEIATWPATMQKDIYEMCQKLSALDKEAESDSKKP